MFLIPLLVTVLIFGLLFWAINRLPIDPPFREIALVVLVIIFVIYLVQFIPGVGFPGFVRPC